MKKWPSNQVEHSVNPRDAVDLFVHIKLFLIDQNKWQIEKLFVPLSSLFEFFLNVFRFYETEQKLFLNING